MDGNHASSVSAKGGLTVTQTSGAGTKVGTSDPMVACGCAMAHRLKGLSLIHISEPTRPY